MRRLWARIGVAFYVSETEYEKLLDDSRCNGRGYLSDVDISIDINDLILHKAEIEGDCYIPRCVFEDEESK